MSDDDIARQADALRDYMRRGGSRFRWFESKDFETADREAILRAVLNPGADTGGIPQGPTA